MSNKIIESNLEKQKQNSLHSLEQLQKERDSENTKHETEIQTMKEQMSQIMSLIQQNPKLSQVKPESLLKKKL